MTFTQTAELLRGVANQLAGGNVGVMQVLDDKVYIAIDDNHGAHPVMSYEVGEEFNINTTRWRITEVLTAPPALVDAPPGSSSGTVAALIEQVRFLPSGVVFPPEMQATSGEQVHAEAPPAHRSAMKTLTKRYAYDVQTQPKPVALRILLTLAGFVPVPFSIWDISSATTADWNSYGGGYIVVILLAGLLSWFLINLANTPDEVRLIVPTEPREELS